MNTAPSLALAPSLLLPLLVLLTSTLPVSPTLPPCSSATDTVISGDEGWANITTFQVAKEHTDTYLFVYPEQGFKGVSLEAAADGWRHVAWFMMNTCFPSNAKWWVFLVEILRLRNNNNDDERLEFQLRSGVCRVKCIETGPVPGVLSLQVLGHGASRWRFSSPFPCTATDVPGGPLQCYNCAEPPSPKNTTTTTTTTTTLTATHPTSTTATTTTTTLTATHPTTSTATTTTLTATHPAIVKTTTVDVDPVVSLPFPDETEDTTPTTAWLPAEVVVIVVLVVVVVVGVIVAVVIVAVVVVKRIRQRRETTAEPISHHVAAPNVPLGQGVDASLGVRSEPMEGGNIYTIYYDVAAPDVPLRQGVDAPLGVRSEPMEGDIYTIYYDLAAPDVPLGQEVAASLGERSESMENNIYEELDLEPRRAATAGHGTTPRQEDDRCLVRNMTLKDMYDDVVFDDGAYLTPRPGPSGNTRRIMEG